MGSFRLDERASFPAQLFVNTYNVTAASQGYNLGMINEMPQNLGVSLIIILLFYFIFCMGRKETSYKLRMNEYFAILFLILSLFLTTSLMPYTTLANLIPALQYPLKNIQYPWRFLSLAGVFLVWLLCISLKKQTVPRQLRYYISIILICAVFWQSLTLMSNVLFQNTPLRVYDEGNLTTYEISGGEYLPPGKKPDMYLEELSYDKSSISVIEWTRKRGLIEINVQNLDINAQQLEVPLLYNKGYKAINNAGILFPISASPSGRVSIILPGKYSGTFTVKFSEPWYWRISELISIICGISLFLQIALLNDHLCHIWRPTFDISSGHSRTS